MSERVTNGKDWFTRAFDDHYAQIYRHKDDDAPAEVQGVINYLRLRRSRVGPQTRVLDLACGWARHSVLLARRGFDVTGVDFSDVMLRLATERATEAEVECITLPADQPVIDTSEYPAHALKLLQADMRSLPFVEQFDVVLDLFTSFGYFRDSSDNDAVLDAIGRALVPGGKLLIDVDNPQYFVESRQERVVSSIPGESGVPERVLKVERYLRARDRRVVIYEFIDRPAPERERIYLETKLYDQPELAALLGDHGLEVRGEAWGDYNGAPYSSETPRLIMVAQKEGRRRRRFGG